VDPFATNFTLIDGIIVAVYLAGSLAVGVFANKFIHSASAYLVGGAASGTALNIATYIGTGLGLVTLMYASIEGVTHGFAYLVLPVIGFAMGAVIGGTGVVIRPLRERGLLTITEFFQERYGTGPRVLAGSIAALAGIVNMGLFPKMGATFITYATGMGGTAEETEWLVNLITSALIVLVLVYTVLGGMVSVIITDYVQFIVLSIGMAVGIYCCLTHPGLGWDTMTTTLAETRGERMFNPLAEGSGYGWSWLVLQLLVTFVAGFAWAPEASRALTANSSAGARRTFLLSAPGQFARLAIPAFWGIAAFTLVSQSPELTAHFFPDGLDGDPSQVSAMMPLALGQVVPPVLLGVLVAGLLAAFMSTHDSYLLCWSSVIARDVVAPLRGGRLTERGQITVTRLSVLAIGVFLLVWGIWYDLPDSVWNYMAISGTIYLAGAGLALLGGCYWKPASKAGAVACMLTGLIAIVGLFVEPINGQLQRAFGDGVALDGITVALATFGLCAVVFVVVSLAVPDQAKPAEVQPPAEGGA